MGAAVVAGAGRGYCSTAGSITLGSENNVRLGTCPFLILQSPKYPKVWPPTENIGHEVHVLPAPAGVARLGLGHAARTALELGYTRFGPELL